MKRLAVHVEDHPIEYFDFEGVIGQGEYGGGDVIVWDWGTWSPSDKHKEPTKAVAKGELHVDLAGEKLAGRFAFVRRGTQGDKEQWLLVHKHDDAAIDGWDPEEHPRSVKSGRTNDEVAADPDLRWHGDRPASEAAEAVTDGNGSTKSRRTTASDGRVGGRARSLAKLRRTRWGAGIARRAWSAPTDDELAALDAIDRDGTWSVDGVEVKVTNLDKVLFPARRRRGAGDQARADPLPRADRPARPPLPGRPTGEPAAVPRRRRPARASGTRRSRPRRPTG